LYLLQLVVELLWRQEMLLGDRRCQKRRRGLGLRFGRHSVLAPPTWILFQAGHLPGWASARRPTLSYATHTARGPHPGSPLPRPPGAGLLATKPSSGLSASASGWMACDILLAQLAAQHLADQRLGQRVAELELLGHLVRGQPLPAKGRQLVSGQRLARL